MQALQTLKSQAQLASFTPFLVQGPPHHQPHSYHPCREGRAEKPRDKNFRSPKASSFVETFSQMFSVF